MCFSQFTTYPIPCTLDTKSCSQEISVYTKRRVTPIGWPYSELPIAAPVAGQGEDKILENAWKKHNI